MGKDIKGKELGIGISQRKDAGNGLQRQPIKTSIPTYGISAACHWMRGLAYGMR